MSKWAFYWKKIFDLGILSHLYHVGEIIRGSVYYDSCHIREIIMDCLCTICLFWKLRIKKIKKTHLISYFFILKKLIKYVKKKTHFLEDITI